ncbi:MAG TPA: hypothetical protein VGV68_04245 [Terriglobia bacterium]|nr:hypothetical protein [Terriglobia bacterium]
MNRIEVGLKSIGRNLELSDRGFIDLFREGHGIACCAPSKMPRDNQFSVALHPNEAIGVTPTRVARDITLLLATHESPNFVTLNIYHGNRVNLFFKQSLASFSGHNQDTENGVPMSARESFNAAHADAFHKHLKYEGCLFSGSVHPEESIGARFRINLSALAATESLLPLAGLSEFFALSPVIVACHFRLVLFAGQADNVFVVGIAAYPAC